MTAGAFSVFGFSGFAQVVQGRCGGGKLLPWSGPRTVGSGRQDKAEQETKLALALVERLLAGAQGGCPPFVKKLFRFMHKNTKLLYKKQKILYKETRAKGLPQIFEGNFFFWHEQIRKPRQKHCKNSAVLLSLQICVADIANILVRLRGRKKVSFKSYDLSLTFCRRFI
ncbi:MAG: hypothetical protein MJ183_06455 [Treponemataceae bacterium]|nr:hypothetical protein [Treponemataceae bacterium]